MNTPTRGYRSDSARRRADRIRMRSLRASQEKTCVAADDEPIQKRATGVMS